MITGMNYIGRELSAQGTDLFTSYDPRTGEPIAEFHEASDQEINAAVQKAINAFPQYSKVSDEGRAKFLREIAKEILELGDELIHIYCKESGLPEGRARGERGRTIGQLNAFADHISTAEWRDDLFLEEDLQREPQPRPSLFRSRIPIGPVAVFGAGNFPLAFSTAGGDTASALAAGCPVVVKAHPLHPATGELVSKAIIRAADTTGMPDGVFSNLNGKGISLGQALVKHPGIRAVGFTGSLKGGRALYDLAASRKEPIPVFAEMGSVNPVIISSTVQDKDAQGLASQLLGSFTMGAGQFCTCPGLIFSTGFSESFKEELSNGLTQADAQCMLSQEMKNTFERSRQTIFEHKGVMPLFKGESREGAEVLPSMAIVSGEDFLRNEELQEEVFGPFTLLVECSGMEELKAAIAALQGQLTISLFEEKDALEPWQEILSQAAHKAGRVILNAMPTGVEVSPAMTHGGPYPASTDPRFTSVGIPAIDRWLRPVTFQGFPEKSLVVQNQFRK